MKVVALITSRINSTRLPNKALLDICGKPMLQRVYERTKLAKCLDDVWIATTRRSTPIKKFCLTNEMPCYRGDEEDILGRLYYASRKAKADIIVRVWGDAPLIDPQVIDDTVKYYFNNDLMYATNYGFPAGLNVAVISYGALQKAHRKIKDPEKRHWIHKYFTDNQKEFRVGEYRNSIDYSNLDWSVDVMWDLRFARIVYEELGENFGWKEIYRLLCRTTSEKLPIIPSGTILLSDLRKDLSSVPRSG